MQTPSEAGRTAHVDTFVRDRLPPAHMQPQFRFELPELRYPERLNAAVELLDRAVDEGHGERVAVIDAAGSWSYARLRETSDGVARLLAEAGLVPGNRVLIGGVNSAWLFAAWFGVLKAGGVLVTVMPMLRGREVATILERAGVGFAIVEARCMGEWRAALDERGVRVFAYDEGGLGLRPGGGFAPVETARDDPAMIAFTSGTTGVPKGCIHFHRDVLAPADSYCRHVLAPREGDVWMGSPPIAFTFGLGGLLIFPFRFRGTAVLVDRATPTAMLDAVERHRVTTLFTAPTAYKAMLGQIEGRDLSSLRTCVSAGEHLPRATWEAWAAATGLPLLDGIGATEMMHIFISAPPESVRPGATGRAVPGYAACVLGEDGRPLAQGVGRLAVQGPTGCRYLDDPRQADYVQGGWNVTGDTYRLDKDGYFCFVARSDDMIISSGYNIAAPEVEAALHSHAAVLECAVVAAPCEERGAIVKAYVVAADGHAPGEALAAELQRHVKQVIAPYKYPRAVEFVGELPKTHTGKIQRFALRG